MRAGGRGLVGLAAGLVLALAWGRPSQAQEARDGAWKLDGELGASLFFGASQQTAINLRSSVSRAAERVEWSGGGAFVYGKAKDPASGESFVNKRSWSANASLNYDPQGRLSPFVSVTAEGSFERRIDLRVSSGAGGKVRFVRTGRSTLDVGLAALAERTEPRAVEGASQAGRTLARWSARLRARHAFADERTTVNFVTFYRPAFRELRDYTIDLETSLAYALTPAIGFKVSLVDTYDAFARDRGAVSNNNGRLYFSILATAG